MTVFKSNIPWPKHKSRFMILNASFYKLYNHAHTNRHAPGGCHPSVRLQLARHRGLDIDFIFRYSTCPLLFKLRVGSLKRQVIVIRPKSKAWIVFICFPYFFTYPVNLMMSDDGLIMV